MTNSKTILLVSDNLEIKPALKRWFKYIDKPVIEIIDPFEKLSRPLKWSFVCDGVQRAIEYNKSVNAIILINAFSTEPNSLGLFHVGMEFIHYLRVELECRNPVIIYCCESKDQFIESHPLHRILLVEEKHGWKGHSYWNTTEGCLKLVGLIETAEPFLGNFHELKGNYCTLPGLAAYAGHNFEGYLRKYTPKVALTKLVDYLRKCLPTESAVNKFKNDIYKVDSSVAKEDAKELVEPFLKELPTIIERYKGSQKIQ